MAQCIRPPTNNLRRLVKSPISRCQIILWKGRRGYANMCNKCDYEEDKAIVPDGSDEV